jgi:outer membrane biosynthesis protein TonB
MNARGARPPDTYSCRRAVTVLALFLFVQPALASESSPQAVAADSKPKLPFVKASQFEACLPKERPASAGAEKVVVVATVSPEGKAGNLRFPADIEPWQKAVAECVMGMADFEPATRDGLPVAAEVSLPINFSYSAGSSANKSNVVPPRLKPGDSERLSSCYARSARLAGAEGQVEVLLTVGTDGRVSDYQLPAGIERWQEVTSRCVVEQLTFEPATRDGVPFAAKTKFPINFSLEGNDPLTLAKLVASEGELAKVTQVCYPAGKQETANPEYRVTVNVRGWPSQVMLVKSSGDRELDAAGACVLKRLRYEPAKRGERPVMSTLLVPITLRPPK